FPSDFPSTLRPSNTLCLASLLSAVPTPRSYLSCVCSFLFNPPATPEIYTLSLHDALPISPLRFAGRWQRRWTDQQSRFGATANKDRKSTRLNSSHQIISYAVFCLKKKNKTIYKSD